MDCIFCKIANGAIPVEFVYQDDTVVAFRDNNPQAPVHLLVIPHAHLTSHAHATAEHEALLGHLLFTATGIARDAGLDDGYRLVINSGDNGGQTVPHLHMHVLGGRQMHWPPG